MVLRAFVVVGEVVVVGIIVVVELVLAIEARMEVRQPVELQQTTVQLVWELLAQAGTSLQETVQPKVYCMPSFFFNWQKL